MVSPLGWIDGLTAALIIVSSVIFGLLSLYKSIKLKAKLLAIAGVVMILVGMLWLGPTIDFLMVLIWQTNITPIWFYSILSYVWVAPALLFSMWLGGELIVPKRKWILVGIFVVLGVVFEYFLWFHISDSFTWTLGTPGEDLIDASFVRTHPTFLMVVVMLVAVLIFLGIGFFLKAKQATGSLRKKFFFLGLGFTIFVVCAALDSILTPGISIGFVRVVMASFAIWMYLGLKT